jgi:predicted chitinase
MIISFPFLQNANLQETDAIDDGTFNLGEKSGKGAFPVSHQFGWHGGVHLVAPGGPNKPEPVRAIADGQVVFARHSDPMPLNSVSDEIKAAHPLLYYKGWTSNGVMILKHETEIGEGVRVTFYSIYQHLHIVANKPGTETPLKKGDKVYRKDPIGKAGAIYGNPNRVHFEIIADKGNVEALMGRSAGKLTAQQGRRTSVWGDIHIVLPASTPFYAQDPRIETKTYVVRTSSPGIGGINDTLNSVAQRFHTTPARIRQLNGTPAKAANWWSTVTAGSTVSQRIIRVPAQFGAAATMPPSDLTIEDWRLWQATIAGRTPAELIVTLSEERGTITLTTRDRHGTVIGRCTEADGSYNLYKAAIETYPGCPSAGYEMLRFGRVLGPDEPAATDMQGGRLPHLRKIVTQGGAEAFVDLNIAGVKVYSDADFPHWLGWTFIDDDIDDNGRCDSKQLLDLIEPMAPTPNPAPGLPGVLGEVVHTAAKVFDAALQYKDRLTRAYAKIHSGTMRKRLSYCVVNLPTEWSRDDFDKRWGWIKGDDPTDIPANVLTSICLSPDAYEKFKRHHAALAFWEDAAKEDLALDKMHCHFHPLRFIEIFRKCAWFSEPELLSILSPAPATGKQRANALRIQMNRMLSKYSASGSYLRVAHFLAQVGVETGWWQYREELGNERYFRTMYEAITPEEAGQDYDTAVSRERNLPSGRRPTELPNPGPNPKPTINRPNYVATRPGQIAQKAAGMDNGAANAANGGMTGDGNRFHGRGFLQITGRRNYKSYQDYRGSNFTTGPNSALLATDDYNACDASGFYWSREKVNRYADQGDQPEAITRVGSMINRGNPSGIPFHNADRHSAFNIIWNNIREDQ